MVGGVPDNRFPGPNPRRCQMSRQKVVGVRVLWAVFMVLGIGACASGSGGGGGGPSNVITGQQLIETRQSNLYAAIQVLRPAWLRSRGSASISSPSEVTLFVNEAPYGTVNNLSGIPIDAVLDVRYLSASEAGSRYGTAAGNGGLLLVRLVS
jgi:hypothetical protein